MAGIVVVRQEPDGSHRVLALLPGSETTSPDGQPSYKFYGTYDIPKGHAKQGEPPLDAALREAGEETGYTLADLDFRWGQESSTMSKGKKTGTFFVAATDVDPTISRNPENGMLEHGGFKWVTFDEMMGRVGRFWFGDAIAWARDVVESGDGEITGEAILRGWVRELLAEQDQWLAEARYKGFRREVKERDFPHLPEFVFKDLYDREGLKDYIEDRAEDIQHLGMEEFFTTNEYAKESYDRYNLNWSKRPIVLDLNWEDIGAQERDFLMKKHRGADPNFPQEEYKAKLDRVLSTTPGLGTGDHEPVILKMSGGKVEDIMGGRHRTMAAFIKSDFQPIKLKAYVGEGW